MIRQELSDNFIEYAAAVNSDRAIPDARNGLKPVARRILYGAYKGGRSSSKPHVKAAKVVGDVMGELHPHGDTSIYDAMVRLSQPWELRYPLIDFHGNQGSITGDGAAAMRYTEVRLAKLAEDGMLRGLKKNCVDFMPNYDETTEEPMTLPSIFPNLLCNPNIGIGVAMSTSWASHNLREVANAINNYLDGKEPTLIGPDFPTGGIVINGKDIPAIMKTGKGSVKVRSRYKIEGDKLVFYEIPYGISVEDLLDNIGAACEDEKLFAEVSDVRDETNKKGVRIVVECVRGTNLDVVANKLFAKTKLQKSFSYNQVALVDRTPVLLNLKQAIEIYVKHNIECIVREAQFDLDKAQDRLHILEGLLKALEDIDNVIALIKQSESAKVAKVKLMEKYGFSEEQAKAILDMKLSKLANLEKIEIENEKAELIETIEELTQLVNNKDRQEKELRDRLAEIVKKYGDDRRTEIIDLEIPKEEKKVEIVAEDTIVIVSEQGSIRRVKPSTFKSQKRGGKGKKSADGMIISAVKTNTTNSLLLFSNLGKFYRISVNDIAETAQALTNYIKLGSNEKILTVASAADEEYIIFLTAKGMLKKSKLSEYEGGNRKTGVAALKLKEGDSVAKVLLVNDEDILLLSASGMSIRISTKEISAIGRTAAGVKGMTLADNDSLLSATIVREGEDYLFFCEDGHVKRIPQDEIRTSGRATVGKKIVKDKKVVDVVTVNTTSEILVYTTIGSVIKIAASDISNVISKVVEGKISKVSVV
ncbi:MAG: DNA topoisomerase 4 subunit A [Erysipelotrichaceae bacterium]|nr:DNA topoisomerase 4 subunit A [Erysipelotrichaceae bacterium]